MKTLVLLALVIALFGVIGNAYYTNRVSFDEIPQNWDDDSAGLRGLEANDEEIPLSRRELEETGRRCFGLIRLILRGMGLGLLFRQAGADVSGWVAFLDMATNIAKEFIRSMTKNSAVGATWRKAVTGTQKSEMVEAISAPVAKMVEVGVAKLAKVMGDYSKKAVSYIMGADPEKRSGWFGSLTEWRK